MLSHSNAYIANLKRILHIFHVLKERLNNGSKIAIIFKDLFKGFYTLRKMCPYLEFFWSVFSRIWTEYEKIRTRTIPNTDTFTQWFFQPRNFTNKTSLGETLSKIDIKNVN